VLHIIIERGEHIIPMRVLLCTADQNLLNPTGKLYTRDELDCQRRHSCSAGEFFGSFLSVFVFLCVIQMRSCVLIFLWPDDEQLRDDKSEREQTAIWQENDLFSGLRALRTQLCERVFSAPQSTHRMPLFWSHQRTLPLSQLMGTFYSI
jgi:hypothetical protein